jgi:acetoin utilization protein AcuB
MTTPMPTVRAFMTACPHTVGAEQTVSYAHTLLYQHRVRQLPVLSDGQLVGLLSERDLTLIASLREPDLHQIKVEEVMSLSIYKVSPDALLEQVASEMASKKYGAAIVVEHNSVVGIFTTVDVCNALVAVLKDRQAS